MALEYVDVDAGSLVVPGAYSSVKVQNKVQGLSTTGVLMLVGEADSGLDYASETDLNFNSFGPDQEAQVLAKYKSGPLVDAFRAATAAANDPEIPATFSRAILVKTNKGAKATGILLDSASAQNCGISDKSYGSLGNLIACTVEAAVAEALPTTGSVAWIPPVGTVNYGARVSGGTAVTTAQIAAATTPATIASTLDGLTGIACTGGTDRTLITGATNVAVTADANAATNFQATFATATTWNAQPQVGDTVIVGATAAIKGASNENVGGWVVISVPTTTYFVAKKMSDASKAGATAGTVTTPVSVASVSTAVADFKAYAPIVISAEAGAIVNGFGKSIELCETSGGTDLLSRCFATSTGATVSFVSKTTAPTVIKSAAEYRARLKVARQVDGISDTIEAGGEVALTLGYTGTSATCQITATQAILAVVGGTGAGKTINLKDFPTVADLAAYINTLTGWSAAAETGIMGNMPTTALDEGTFNCANTNGGRTGRIKVDAYKFAYAVTNGTSLVFVHKIGDTSQSAPVGLPGVTATTFLTGGTRGATTAAGVSAAVDALEKCKGNFVVPLFSRDATLDIADGLTDSSSTYTIDAINAYVKTHVLKMSQIKRRRNRQAFLSKRDTIQNCVAAAGNVASFRCAMTFEDDKTVSNGVIVQYQPWMLAVKAAAMQAGAFYKSLVHKGINTSGVLQAAGDWTFDSDGDLETALRGGLLPAARTDDGGFWWVSDQTTYGKDSNWVYNSIQMVYAADIVALTTAQRMEKAFVGQSLADVSAAVALAYLEGIMADYMRLKLIASSDDAPLGFRNAKVVIEGPAMRVSIEIKLAGSIYFVPITFYVTQITQSASQKA